MKTMMLATITLLLVSCLFGLYEREEWIGLRGGKEGEAPVFDVLHDDADSTKILVQLKGFWVENRVSNDGKHRFLRIPGMYDREGAPGQPQIPLIDFGVGVHPTRDIDVSCSRYRGKVFTDWEIYKTPVEDRIYDIDAEIRSNSAAYPSWVVRRSSPMAMRNVRNVTVHCNPFEYNKDDNVLVVYDSLIVTLKYSGRNDTCALGALDRTISSVWEPVVNSMIVNGGRYTSVTTTANPRLLILVVKSGSVDFGNKVEEFVLWKTRMGYEVFVERLSSPTVSSVYETIEEYYVEKEIDYVLIVGDNDLIPTYTGDGTGGFPEYYTVSYTDTIWYPGDNLYCCMPAPGPSRTVDEQEDIMVGRISINSLDEFDNVIEKIFAYERPTDGASFWNKSAWELSAHRELGGLWSFAFMDAQITNGSYAEDNGLTVRYRFGQDYTYHGHSVSMASNADIVSDLNDYEDIGLYWHIGLTEFDRFAGWNWLGEDFSYPDVDLISNTDRNPICIVLGGQTLDITNERTAPSLGEYLTNRGTDGASLFYGATAGFHDGAWTRTTDFANWLARNILSDMPSFETFGQIENATSNRMSFSELRWAYNIIGDPTMVVNNGPVQDMIVKFDPSCDVHGGYAIQQTSDGSDVTIKIEVHELDGVTPVVGAEVTLWIGEYDYDATTGIGVMDNDVFRTTKTNSFGEATFLIEYHDPDSAYIFDEPGSLFVGIKYRNRNPVVKKLIVGDFLQTPTFYEGWNLVSIPYRTGNEPLGDILTGASAIYKFDAPGYVSAVDDTNEIGRGYWVLYTYDKEEEIFGEEVDSFQTHVGPDWSIMGSVSDNVIWNSGYLSNPACLLAGPWGWNGVTYFDSDSIESGLGYWILLSDSCTISIPSDSRGHGRLRPSIGALFLLPNPPDPTLEKGAIPEDSLHFDVDIDWQNNSVTVRDRKSGKQIEQALVAIQVGESVDFQYTGAKGTRYRGRIYTNLDIEDDDNTWVVIFKPGYVEYVYHSGKEIIDGIAWNKSEIATCRELDNIVYTGALEAVLPFEPIDKKEIAGNKYNDPTLSESVPEVFGLGPVYPNPFNSATTIEFSIGEDCDVRLEVYNSLGKKVRTLYDGEIAAGSYRVIWDARNGRGERLPAGLYFCRISTQRYESTEKILLIY